MKQFSTLRSACISCCNSSMNLYSIDLTYCSLNMVGAKRRSRPVVALLLAQMGFCNNYAKDTVYKNKHKEMMIGGSFHTQAHGSKSMSCD